MKEYKGYLIDDDLRIYSKRTGLELTPHMGSDGYMQNDLTNLEWTTNSNNVQQYWDKTEVRRKHRTPVLVTNNSGFYKEYDSIRQLSEDLHLDRHKVARILAGEITNRYDYDFSYM